MPTATLPIEYREDIVTLWNYNQMHHELRSVDLAVGLGSHDLGVATYTAELYHLGLFPAIVFTGANAPTTLERFPRGEAVHYREQAIHLGVPDSAVLVEPEATNTGENIDFTKALIESRGLDVNSLMLVSRPYQQRRAFAIAKLRWPKVAVVCASQSLSLDAYVEGIGDANRVINMLVGDTQRLWIYAEKGWAARQDVSNTVRVAYDRLVTAGFTQRLLAE